MTRNDVVRIPLAIPGAVVRLAALCVAVVAALLLVPIPFWQIVAVVAGLLGAVLPRSFAIWAAAACLPFGMLYLDVDPWRAAMVILAVHLMHVLGTLNLAIPLRARVQLRAFAPSALRFLWMQGVAQILCAAVLLGMPAIRGAGLAWAAPVGAAAIAVLAVVLVAMSQRPSKESDQR